MQLKTLFSPIITVVLLPTLLVAGTLGFNKLSEASPQELTTRSMVYLDGHWYRAYEIARKRFFELKDLTDEQKDLKNYRISFIEEDGFIYVEFVPRSTPYTRVEPTLCRTPFGRDVRYVFKADSLKLVSFNDCVPMIK